MLGSCWATTTTSPCARPLAIYSNSALGRDAGIDDAEKILLMAEPHFGLGGGEIGRLPRGDLRRVAIGWAIHRRCCLPLSWVAEQLKLSSAANASQQIRRFDERKPRSQVVCRRGCAHGRS